MPRWEHGSENRLKTAALELFEEQGFEKISVIEIAERARVATRTFFRYFSDKREVLFGDADALHVVLMDGILQADDAEPLQLVVGVLASFDWEGLGLREAQRRRHAVIAANPDLLERELIKRHSIEIGFTAALRQRGVEADVARLAAAVGSNVFFAAYRQWLEPEETADLPALSERMMTRLTTIIPASSTDGRWNRSKSFKTGPNPSSDERDTRKEQVAGG